MTDGWHRKPKNPKPYKDLGAEPLSYAEAVNRIIWMLKLNLIQDQWDFEQEDDHTISVWRRGSPVPMTRVKLPERILPTPKPSSINSDGSITMPFEEAEQVIRRMLGWQVGPEVVLKIEHRDSYTLTVERADGKALPEFQDGQAVVKFPHPVAKPQRLLGVHRG